ncbi:hypothetical protein BS50DRAFT_569323 [Corynespora cassiicola Philippines]|uniref:Uncharacterized protein n=1 Tax=Corynespora cassiicola Philippines TaxID=1448308 RepID=A0A2T2P2D9_CORCC|nr:hypothetical protein BS50DRAFT_569323 [Corynespora cassiicola Philippines]
MVYPQSTFPIRQNKIQRKIFPALFNIVYAGPLLARSGLLIPIYFGRKVGFLV